AVERRKHMLDHFDLRAVSGQRGAPRNFDSMRDVGADSPRRAQIRPDEDDAVMRRSRTKFDLHVAPAPITKARHRARASKCPLVSQGCRQGCVAKRVVRKSTLSGRPDGLKWPSFVNRSADNALALLPAVG